MTDMSDLPPINDHRKFSEDLMGELMMFIDQCVRDGALQEYQGDMLCEQVITVASILDNAFDVRTFIAKGEKK